MCKKILTIEKNASVKVNMNGKLAKQEWNYQIFLENQISGSLTVGYAGRAWSNILEYRALR